MPAHQLDLALWLEADRMATLLDALSQENLDNQREVVKNEKRWSYDNRPYGSFQEKLQGHLYPPKTIRTTTRRSARWRTSTRPRSRTSASSSGRTTRRTTRSCRSSATWKPPHVRAAAERFFGAIPANPDIPPLGDLSLPMTLGGERPRDGLRQGPAAARLRRVPGAGLRRPTPRCPRHGRPDPVGREGEPAQPPPRP